MVTTFSTRSRFHAWMGALLALAIVAGFARTFYLRAWFDVPALPVLLYLHGVLFTAWVLLYIAQVSLVATGNVAQHRRLGRIGAAMVAVLVVVGLTATAMSAAVPKPHVGGLSSAQFSLIPLVEVLGFAGFVFAALLNRGKPQVHKRFMLLAMIAAVAPATARLISLAGMGEHYLALQTASAAAFVGWMALNDWRQLHKVHRVTAVWGSVVLVSWPLRMWVAGSDVWWPAGKWIASLASTQ